MATTLLDELHWRGLIHDVTPGLDERLARGPITGYIGFDPTAPSLQVGNLVAIMLLAHLQRMGGKPIVLLGGGTGLIGDPSGKRAERPLLDAATLEQNSDRQRAQFERFLEFSGDPAGAELLDNADWLVPLNLVAFLRDVGKHFTLSYMLQKESVKARIESGISYTEFSYMLLQAYDFWHLFRTKRCELQLGGSDQWGNITAGRELIRRVEGREAYGLSAPLFTTATGAKFGKTEEGSVWLDAAMTPPYRFYQFWVNADDRDVEPYLKIFTFRSQDDIGDLMQRHRTDPGGRIPHRELARELTAKVHGEATAAAVADASRILFGELDPQGAAAGTWAALAAALPSAPLPSGFGPDTPVVDLVAATTLVTSKGDARRQLKQGGISINGRRVAEDHKAGPPLDGGYYWIRRGKKHDFLFTAST